MLQVVYQDDRKQRAVVPLESDDTVTVGRKPGSTIRTRNPSVSRRHAEMSCVDGVWTVKDLGSSNHTYLNGKKVSEAPVTAGDTLRFGDFKIKVQGVRERGDGVEAKVKPAPPSPPATPEPAQSGAKRARPTRGDASEGRGADDVPAVTAAPDGDTGEGRRRRPERPTSSGGSRPDAEAAESPHEPVPDSVATEGLGQELRQAQKESRRLRRELNESADRVEELMTRIQELEAREQRYEEELDGWHERHQRLRDQVDHNQELVAETRESLDLRAGEVETLENRVHELEVELASRESSDDDTQDLVSELKSKVVQKDRRLEDLQRELDHMEYDLRSAREEHEALQDTFRHDGSEQRRLTRELELLREVNRDKENVVAQLKIEIEDQSREIYDLKLGTGVKDLEEAKRDVLEKYFESNREVDSLKGRVKELEHELASNNTERSALEEQLGEKRDVTLHPDYQRKMRELERSHADLEESQAEVSRLEERFEEFGPDVKARLDAELNFLQRKNTALQEKLEALQARGQQGSDSSDDAAPSAELEDLRAELRASERKVSTLTEALENAEVSAEPGVASETTGDVAEVAVLRADAVTRLEDVLNLHEQIKTNLDLLKTQLAEVGADAAEADLTASMESAQDLVSTLHTSASGLGRELKDLETLFEE